MSVARPRYVLPPKYELQAATFLGHHECFDLYHKIESDGKPELYAGSSNSLKHWILSLRQAKLFATHVRLIDLGPGTVTAALAVAYSLAYEIHLDGCVDAPSIMFMKAQYAATRPERFVPVEVTDEEVAKEKRLLDLLPPDAVVPHVNVIGTFAIHTGQKLIQLNLRSKWYKVDHCVKYLSLWVKLGFTVKFSEASIYGQE